MRKLFKIGERKKPERFNEPFSFVSYSQEGEDKILQRFFDWEGEKDGFYIDVGAFNPIEHSNTYLFYQKGWRGINIDATPGSMELFKKLRPRDINLEIPVARKEGTLPFYVFNRGTLNTFSKEEALKKDGWNNFKLIKAIDIRAYPLSSILDKYLSKDINISFMDIDVEGLDLEVLQSNNWEKYRPKIVLVEVLRKYVDEITNDEIYLFMREKGYRLAAKTFNTLFFVEKGFKYSFDK